MSKSGLVRVSFHGTNQSVSLALNTFANGKLSSAVRSAFDGLDCDAEALNVSLDLREIGWVGSSGLSHLIEIHRYVKRLGGQVTLKNVGESVSETLRLTRLERLFRTDAMAGDVAAGAGANPRLV